MLLYLYSVLMLVKGILSFKPHTYLYESSFLYGSIYPISLKVIGIWNKNPDHDKTKSEVTCYKLPPGKKSRSVEPNK